MEATNLATADLVIHDPRDTSARRRVEGLLVSNLVIISMVLTGMTIVQVFIVQSVWILVLLALTTIYGSTLVWARIQNRLGRLDRAVLAMNLAVWPLAIGGTLLVPQALPITCLSGLGPVLLAVPELSRRAVARVLALSVALTFAITVIATFSLTELADSVPKATMDVAIVLAVPALVGLILVIGGQNHQLLTERALTLAASRRRIIDAADRERRRIERDLHDGAQQRLHGALVQISVAKRKLVTDREEAIEFLRDARAELVGAIDDLRDLVNGLHPAVLDDFGLARALQPVAARRTPSAVLQLDGVGRYTRAVEGAVWFCCLEALANIDKHAGPGRSVMIRIVDRGTTLTFAVSDDGPGFAVPDLSAATGGLRNMVDRIEALGGSLSVVSTADGTTVLGALPVNASVAAP